MYKAYKFRLYTNGEQKALINKTFGCQRFVYNHYLNNIKDNGYRNAYSNINDYTNNLQYKYVFLQEVDSTSIRKTLFHLDDNFKRHYNNNFGYPKYKSKYAKNSYMTSAVYRKYKNKEYCNIEINLKDRVIKLPKLKEVKIRGYRKLDKINGRVINATISREANGKYYVSVMCELPDIKKIIPNTIVGIDLGIKKLVTLSDGVTYDNNKYIEKYENKIKRLQRELSRKEKGSNNYNKCRKKLNILYTKLKNARKYNLHHITKEITENYDIITCEKLNTKKMIEKKVMSKRIADATLSEILRELNYKAKEKGKYFYQVSTYYPSSQLCSVCNIRDTKYKNLNERNYYCTHCHNELDRDFNASVNIMFEGLKMYMKETLA